jgi:membrane protein YqaA with SNARE-associated domain
VAALSLSNLALLAAVAFGVNLMPAFGPPTWAVLVFFRFRWDIPVVPLVLLGASSASLGRVVLALASRRVGGRLSERRRRSMDVVRVALQGSRRGAWAGLGLFLLSPLPSAQLFVAAGLLRVALVPLTAAFLVGRLVSYSLYVGAASAAKASLGSAFTAAFTSPWVIALQVAMLVGLLALTRVDWPGLIERRRSAQGRRGALPDLAAGKKTAPRRSLWAP